jgi:hypothetical protein
MKGAKTASLLCGQLFELRKSFASSLGSRNILVNEGSPFKGRSSSGTWYHASGRGRRSTQCPQRSLLAKQIARISMEIEAVTGGEWLTQHSPSEAPLSSN